jgi:hypothetical protein
MQCRVDLRRSQREEDGDETDEDTADEKHQAAVPQ